MYWWWRQWLWNFDAGEWRIVDGIRITFLCFLLQLISQLYRCGIIDIKQRTRLWHRLLVGGRRRWTQLFSLLEFITYIHAVGVFVRYQRHVDGCGYRISSHVRLEIQVLFKARCQEADYIWIRLRRWWDCEGRWDLLIVVIVILLDARSKRFPQRRADCVVDSNFIGRWILARRRRSRCWRLRQTIVKLTRIFRLIGIFQVFFIVLVLFRFAIKKILVKCVGGW